MENIHGCWACSHTAVREGCCCRKGQQTNYSLFSMFHLTVSVTHRNNTTEHSFTCLCGAPRALKSGINNSLFRILFEVVRLSYKHAGRTICPPISFSLKLLQQACASFTSIIPQLEVRMAHDLACTTNPKIKKK